MAQLSPLRAPALIVRRPTLRWLVPPLQLGRSRDARLVDVDVVAAPQVAHDLERHAAVRAHAVLDGVARPRGLADDTPLL